MQGLLDDLLTWSQISQQQDGESPEVSGNEVFARVLDSLAVTIANERAEITRGELPRVAVFETHLTQILQNLLSNAIKYRGEEPPRIHVSAEPEGAMWKFTVEDNGIGIDPRYATTIFGLFKRLDRKRYPEGTGIGLALCRRITGQYGGRIWVESEPAKGARFHFTLPAV
jgi:signal transduction histidine kinase